jgi:hypothetical protein
VLISCPTENDSQLQFNGSTAKKQGKSSEIKEKLGICEWVLEFWEMP